MQTIKRHIRVDRREIAYLRYTIESYDGMAVVRTIHPHEAILELQVAPGCEETVNGLLDDMKKNEKISILSLRCSQSDKIGG